MNKLILILAVVCGVAVGVAMTFRRDLQHEREKTHALAERVAVLEPVERPSDMPKRETVALAETVAEPAPPPNPTIVRDEPSKPELSGSPQARRQVERLQAALVNGTPLRDYQVRALIAAIDRLQPNGNMNAQSRDELRRAAADILFESQFEQYAALLDEEARPETRR